MGYTECINGGLKNRATLAASAAAQTSLTEESWKEELEGNPDDSESNDHQKDE